MHLIQVSNLKRLDTNLSINHKEISTIYSCMKKPTK